MYHLASFVLERFRGLRDLRLEQLGRVNLLVGNNNAGKTSVLEALAIYCSPHDPSRWLEVALGRGLRWPRADAALRSLFPQGELRLGLRGEGREGSHSTEGEYAPIQQTPNPNAPLAGAVMGGLGGLALTEQKENQAANAFMGALVGLLLAAQGPQAQSQSQSGIRLSLGGDGQPPVSRDVFAGTSLTSSGTPRLPWALLRPFGHRPSDSELHQRAVDLGLRDDVRQMVQLIDPSIHHIEDLGGELYVTDLQAPERKPMPISWFGDGVRRCLSYALALIECRGGLLLIDELETAIHTSALAAVFRALLLAAEQHDVQVFATTHSLEAVDAILDACKEHGPEALVAYQVQQDRVKRFGLERLILVREEMGVDIRGAGEHS